MMEFFLSKFWAFMVAMVVMGVLVQGMQLEGSSDRSQGLNDLAEELENMFEDLAGAGPGLETVIDMGPLLPSTATLTLFTGYGILIDGGREVHFPIPQFTMSIMNDDGALANTDRLVLHGNDRLVIANLPDGSTMMTVSR